MERERGPFGSPVLILCVGGVIFLAVILALAIFDMFFPDRLSRGR